VRFPANAIVVLAAASLALCTGCGPSGEAPRAPEAERAFAPVRTALDAGAITARGELSVEIAPNVVSMLLSFVLEQRDSAVGITTVNAPDGAVLHDTVFEADSWDARSFSSAIAPEPLVGVGDLALLMPLSPRTPLVSGTYHVALETDPPDAVFSRVTLTVRHDDTGAVAESRPHLVDLHVHVLDPEPARLEDSVASTLDTDWRTVLDRMLVPRALASGTLTASIGAPTERARLGRLDDERELAEACRAIRRAAQAAARGEESVGGRDADSEAPVESGGVPPLHVGLVAEIDAALIGTDADVGAELDDQSDDSDLLTGLSPLPGLPYEQESPNGCVFIAEQAWSGLERGLVVELLAANLLHELGHFAGLSHPSEADGRTFDLLDDTPRCTRADAETCGPAGGADNIMFHSGDESALPWHLSADQAWVLRRHPLFRPAP